MDSSVDVDQISLYSRVKVFITLEFRHIRSIEKDELLSLLDKLICLKNWHGHDHPSIPSLLQRIASILDGIFDLLELSILFLLQQYQMEKHYLGFQHPDLAITLFRIGKAFVRNGQLSEAEAYLSEAIILMENGKKKGKLYATAIYNLGLIRYHNCLYSDAFNMFDVAVNGQLDIVEEMHPEVAVMCLNIGDLQMEVGKLEDAMNNYLKALMIMRTANGNNQSEVHEALYKIGVIHKIRNEHDESLNAFRQALECVKCIENKDSFKLTVLNEIRLIYQFKEDVKNILQTLQKIVKLVKQKLGKMHFCVAIVLQQYYEICEEHGVTECSNIGINKIPNILINSSTMSCQEDSFADKVVKIFRCSPAESTKAAAAA